MATYTVKHSCGHEHEYRLFGKCADRYKKIEWLEGMECPECRLAAEKAAAAEARKKQQGLNLPALTGSPKQVAWAEDIRAQFVEAVLAGVDPGEDAAQVWQKSGLASDVVRLTSAKWWIENRGGDAAEMVRRCKAAVDQMAGLLK